MDEVKVEKFTIQQRDGRSPDIVVTRRIYPPVKHQQRPRKTPTDYGITETQFENILDKASKPKIPDRED